jgi:transcriptional regulator with XRE-family HTH domain
VTKSAFSRRHQQLRTLLADARNRQGVTQVVLAKRLGKPQSFVSKFEGGERRLDVIEFLDVAEALGVDPIRLLSSLRR